MQIFDAMPHSYRDMPERYAETTMVYRDEQSGELAGLSRVLAITQDDAHVFCRADQVAEEAGKVWDIITTFYGAFGFTLTPRLSRRDPSKPEKYLGTTQGWERDENALTKLMEDRGATWVDGIGEAAFYGPKIDFMAKDAIGRTHQVATIQIDSNQPTNFGLVYTNNKGEKENVIVIHAAIMGSIERFMSVLIEHLAGNFPLWLSPVQVAIAPIADAHIEFAEEVQAALIKANIRTYLDNDGDSLGKKIRAAKVAKIPYTLVIGDNEVKEKCVTLESRDGGKVGTLSVNDLIARFVREIGEKK
jgi:threonyl-tRNA synthetase